MILDRIACQYIHGIGQGHPQKEEWKVKGVVVVRIMEIY